MTTGNREYWSRDKKFGLVLTANTLADLLRHANMAGSQETGGILLGRYNASHNCATVDYVSGPPVDSQQGPTTFVRGAKGLKAIIARFWTKERSYYLGEWHLHPGASPEPSQIDLESMVAIACDKNYACPEPVLIIVGGNLRQQALLQVIVTLPDKRHIELLPEVSGKSVDVLVVR